MKIMFLVTEAAKEKYLTVEDVLRRRLLVLHVPHQCRAVWLVGGVLVVVVRGDQQLRILVTRDRKEAKTALVFPLA